MSAPFSYLSRAPQHGARWLRARLRAGAAAPPRLLSLPITDNCNARCVMCDVWKTRATDELDVEALRAILGDRLFSEVTHVGISGGEPSLRSDLPELVAAAVATLPRLASLSITTHGFHYSRWRRFLPELVRICEERGVELALNLSVDGVGEIHDRVRGIAGAFGRVQETHRIARELGVRVVWQCTVSAPNVYSVGDLLRRSRQQRVEIQFRHATEIARLDNEASIREVALDAAQRSFFADFLRSRAVQDATPSPARRLFYADLAERLVTAKDRRAPCYFQSEGVVLDAQGHLYQCSIATECLGNARTASAWDLYFSPRASEIRRRLLERKCPSCMHDQSGAWSPQALAAEAVAVTGAGRKLEVAARAAALVARAAPLVGRATLARTRRPAAVARDGAAIVIGAYGGEHVGDAAILGGVIQRLIADHGTCRVHVASTRPDRTRGWVAGLRVPVPVDVFPYEIHEIRARLPEAAALVFGGGPLMDLPELLALHLSAALSANEHGVPLVFEGIGIGPFRLAPSRELARLLLQLGTSWRVRSRQAADVARGYGLSPDVNVDPAFDYLRTRSTLDAITPAERKSLDRLFAPSVKTRVIAINLRPFWHKYSELGRGAVARAESAFHERFGAGLRRYAETNAVTYVFFPMNPDQYGFSDLTSAYMLRDHLAGVDYRIWEAEPGVDAVLALLRRVDGAVTMRYHASIFSLSQERPTLGIDYQLGGSGKVGNLFAERGNARALRALDFSVDELVDRLGKLTAG
jgi:MoaA/NifB/PqqE/SkfB family radical SAM enzyme/polysaccharide pyruvyl transferase WcaK-like protein